MCVATKVAQMVPVLVPLKYQNILKLLFLLNIYVLDAVERGIRTLEGYDTLRRFFN